MLCSAVDLSLTHCIYCKQDQCSDVQTVTEQPSTPSTPDGEAAAMPARTVTAEFPPALANAERGASAAAGTSGAANAAAAAATDCSAGPKGLLAAECQLRPRNTLAACSTCPAVFHTNCYHVNTGEEVSAANTVICFFNTKTCSALLLSYCIAGLPSCMPMVSEQGICRHHWCYLAGMLQLKVTAWPAQQCSNCPTHVERDSSLCQCLLG